MSNDSFSFTIFLNPDCLNKKPDDEYDNYVYLMLSLTLFNVTANIFVLILYGKVSQRSTSKNQTRQFALFLLLKVLTITEIVFQSSFFICHLIFYLTTLGIIRYTRTTQDSIYATRDILNVITFFLYLLPLCISSVSHIMRNWIVVLISAFRFQCILSRVPVNRRVFSLVRIKLLIGILAIFSIVSTLPRLFTDKLLICSNTNYELFVFRSYFYPTNEDKFYIFCNKILPFIVQNGIPCLVITLLCTGIIIKLRERKILKRNLTARCTKNNNNNSSISNKEEKRENSNDCQKHLLFNISCTVLVIVMCCCFVCLEIPTYLSRVIYEEKYVRLVSNFTSSLDSTVNLFIYILSYPGLYEMLKEYFHFKRTTVSEPNVSS